ncbi:MAG: hypothetical protein EPN91_10640 [Salinibacterium sp.]|nr:MAG: hypothetical protein EPN91_10640 [Salinibacterium sp.]
MSGATKNRTAVGRPRIHFDDAERARAYRERRQAQFEDGEIARERWEAPTPGFVGFIAKRCVGQADDQVAMAIAVLAKTLDGIAAAGGQASLDTAINYVTSRKKEAPRGLD